MAIAYFNTAYRSGSHSGKILQLSNAYLGEFASELTPVILTDYGCNLPR